ncbi:hypothetical protein AJ80_03509 [Polytolypa hystricis UAMH7299]|uniref:Amidase domain-containing protein n=1 Tax=Polytolypa hystricis (strain UAMH7299) TaxID=1447883 RepID=A0A2B7YI17_POLH7|nr:hypothetical protein AJ80_03509 [Polytolypa hystricis UAMH7299]
MRLSTPLPTHKNKPLKRGSNCGGDSDYRASTGEFTGQFIRSPTANNGIYGLKPTAFRIPTDGWSSTMPGANPIVTAIGPLSTSLEGIKLSMKTAIDAKLCLSEPALIQIP